jgi:hypothetical protein
MRPLFIVALSEEVESALLRRLNANAFCEHEGVMG